MAGPPHILAELLEPLATIDPSLLSNDFYHHITQSSHRVAQLYNSLEATIAHSEDPELQAWSSNILHVLQQVEEVGVVGWARWLRVIEREQVKEYEQSLREDKLMRLCDKYETAHERCVAAQKMDVNVGEDEHLSQHTAGLWNLQARCESADENGEEKWKATVVEETLTNEKQEDDEDENVQYLRRRTENLQKRMRAGHGLSMVEAEVLRASDLRRSSNIYEEDYDDHGPITAERGSARSYKNDYESNGTQRHGDNDTHTAKDSTSESEYSRGKIPSMISEVGSGTSHHCAPSYLSLLNFSEIRHTDYASQPTDFITSHTQIVDRDAYTFEEIATPWAQEQEERNEDLRSEYRALFQDLESKYAQHHPGPFLCLTFRLNPPFTIPSHDKYSYSITFRTSALALHFPGGATQDQLLETLKWTQEKGSRLPEVGESETLNMIRIRTQSMEWELKNAIVRRFQGFDLLKTVMAGRWPGEGRGDTYIVSAPGIHSQSTSRENSREESDGKGEDGWRQRPYLKGVAGIEEREAHKEDSVTTTQDGSDASLGLSRSAEQDYDVRGSIVRDSKHEDVVERSGPRTCANPEKSYRRSTHEEVSTHDHDISTTGFYFFPTVSTVVLLTSPKTYLEWPRHTTLRQLRQILVDRKEAGMEIDPACIRVREILEIRDTMGIPDPDMSNGRMVLISLPEEPEDALDIDANILIGKREVDTPFWEKKLWDETAEYPNWHGTSQNVNDRTTQRRERRGADRSHLAPFNNKSRFIDIGSLIRDLNTHPDETSSARAGLSKSELYEQISASRGQDKQPIPSETFHVRGRASEERSSSPPIWPRTPSPLSELPDLPYTATWGVVHTSENEPVSELDPSFDYEQPLEGIRAAPCSPIDNLVFESRQQSKPQIECRPVNYSLDDEWPHGKGEGCESWYENLDPLRTICTFCDSPFEQRESQGESPNAESTMQSRGTYGSPAQLPDQQHINISYESRKEGEDNTRVRIMPRLRGGGEHSPPANAGVSKRVRFYDFPFLSIPSPNFAGSYKDPLTYRRSSGSSKTEHFVNLETESTSNPIASNTPLIDFTNQAYKINEAPPSPRSSFMAVPIQSQARGGGQVQPAPLEPKTWQGPKLSSPYPTLDAKARASTNSLDTQMYMEFKEDLIRKGIYRSRVRKDLEHKGYHDHQAEGGLCGTADSYTLPAEGEAVIRANREEETDIETSSSAGSTWAIKLDRGLSQKGHERETVHEVVRRDIGRKGKERWVPITVAGPSKPRMRNELTRQRTDFGEYDDMVRRKYNDKANDSSQAQAGRNGIYVR